MQQNKSQAVEAFPLHWPAGISRRTKRMGAKFKTAPEQSLKHLVNEIFKLSGDKKPIISSNVNQRKDGLMYSDMARDKIADPGVAVYFIYEGNQVVLACDQWETPVENVRAIGLTIEAMRSLDRWSCSDILQRAFTGFKTLPAAGEITVPTWWTEFGYADPDEARLDDLTKTYRRMSKEVHPDLGGTAEAFAKLNKAFEEGKKYLLNKVKQ